MSLLAPVCLLAFVVNAFVGVFVLFHRRDRFLNQTFFVCAATMAAWSLAIFILAQPIAAKEAAHWVDFLLYPACIAPALFLHLIYQLFDEPRRSWLEPCYLVATALVTMNWLGLFSLGVRPLGDGPGWYAVGSPWAVALLVNAAVLGARAAMVLADHLRDSRGIRQAQAQYLLLALVPLVAGGFHDFFGAYRSTYVGTELAMVPIFPAASAIWAVITGYAVLRYRLMDLDAFVSRGMVRLFTLVTLAVPFFYLLTAAEKAYFGDQSGRFVIMALGVFVVAGLAVPPLRAAAHETLDNFFPDDGRDYRAALLAFSQRSTRILEMDRLISSVNDTLTSTLGVSSAAVYVADADGRLRLGGARGDEKLDTAATLAAFHPLVSWLEKERLTVVREELELDPPKDSGNLLDAMIKANVAVAIPLLTPEEMEGLILLGPREDGAIFSAEDVDVLTILANQLAVAMSNARLYADLKRSRELIQRSDRLSAIGTMAAGLAHEIRNPLVSIRTFTQLLPERLHDEEFRRDFLDLTLSEVDRICALINELLAFARPAPAELSNVELNDCLERLCLLLESQAHNQGVRLRKSLADELPTVICDEDQMKQVIMNVVLNAVQACSGGGTIEVSSYESKRGERRFACIEISDDGPGIEPDRLEHIFDPFFTTRREGTGLGLSIAHQIITRHGGFIEVRSRPSEGTSFQIHVPIDRPVLEVDVSPSAAAQPVRLHG